MNELQSFVALVAEMRAMQREYFATRTYTSLKKSKSLEKRVDESITELKKAMYSAGPTQLSIEFPTQ